MRRMLVALVLLLVSASACAGATRRLRLPAIYEAGHFYARPETRDGHALRLLVDTGGGGGNGLYLLDRALARRFGLPMQACKLGGQSMLLVQPYAFANGKGLPAAPSTPCGAVAMTMPGFRSYGGENGILGAGYLPHFTWTFDYPHRALWLEGPGWKPSAGMHRLTLGFPRDASGHRTSGFPRITLHVGGQPVALLLDTGATAMPTRGGEKASHIPLVHGMGVTSYITTSMMDRWHREHPHWRIVRDGDKLIGRLHARLIEVPRVRIAGWTVGPVWFTERSDHSFAWMSGMMAGPVVGSAGANIFRHFVMTLDYPHQAAWFGCAKGCRPADGRPSAARQGPGRRDSGLHGR